METGSFCEIEPVCVLDFYVNESYQRQGLGKHLFEVRTIIFVMQAYYVVVYVSLMRITLELQLTATCCGIKSLFKRLSPPPANSQWPLKSTAL